MEPQASKVVIVGAGHGGGSVAAYLRQYDHTGPIVLIGEEPLAPYQRPPLSKAWLKGEADAESLKLKPDSWYAEAGIDLRLSTIVTEINRGARTVTLSDGEVIAYDHLVIATGARARALPIPGMELDGVLELRTAADAERLKAALEPAGRKLAVIGGGYVGLECAASGRALGAHVMVLEREPRLLARVACETLSSFFQRYHERHGVAFELGASVTALEGKDGHVSAVVLADGRKIECDAALVGVGAVPNEELARDCGLECANGIVVDLDGRTADPNVFAVGDVTHRPLPLYDRMFRLESVPNAIDQAKHVAASILGRPRPTPEAPWFWSDQYDLKLQIVGIPFDADSQVVRGDVAAAKFAVFHLKGDLIQAVEAVNAAPEFMMGRRLLEQRKPVSREKLADSSISMKEVAV